MLVSGESGRRERRDEQVHPVSAVTPHESVASGQPGSAGAADLEQSAAKCASGAARQDHSSRLVFQWRSRRFQMLEHSILQKNRSEGLPKYDRVSSF